MKTSKRVAALAAIFVNITGEELAAELGVSWSKLDRFQRTVFEDFADDIQTVAASALSQRKPLLARIFGTGQ